MREREKDRERGAVCDIEEGEKGKKVEIRTEMITNTSRS